jgi:MinD-like ATPase involved in chromosome partitioning or flagellar assembly
MSRLALVLDHATEDRLLADMIEHGHTVISRLVSAHELVSRLADLQPDVVLVGAGRSSLSPELLSACDGRGVRVVAVAANDLELHYARTLGLHEVAPPGAQWTQIDDLISGAAIVPHRVGEAPDASRDGSPGRVVTVWGPAGAPGRTTLAIGVAAEVAAAGQSVVLVDADPYGGAIAPALGLLDEAPGFASACRLAGSDALDRAELERIAQRHTAHRAGFRVLTGLVGPSRWTELSADRVERTIDALRSWVDVVVIDTGFSLESDEELTSDVFAPRRNAGTLSALRAADDVIAVGLADPIGLSRFLRGHSELVGLVDPGMIHVVINRVRSSVLGLDPSGQVRQALRRFAGVESATLLPEDRAAADAAILTARPVREAAGGRSALVTGIRSLVDEHVLPRPEPVRRRRPALPGRRRLATG